MTNIAGKVYLLDIRSVVGNCGIFWCPNGNGYTCDMNDAGLYDPGYSSRSTDIEIPEEIARGCAVTHVRVDRLRYEFSKRGMKFTKEGAK